MTFEFVTTPTIVFGAGTLAQLGDRAARFGKKAWLVTGGGALEREGVLERVQSLLDARGVAVKRQSVTGEPDTAIANRGAREALAAGCDVVIGIGGGSVLDTGKAVAGLMANGGDAIDYLEVVGRGKVLEKPGVPFIAVPTTAGTGSEATQNAVLADHASGTKASIRHEHLLPRVALLDPELTRTLPPVVTAGSGLDALIQLIESYVSRRANEMIDALAIAGIRRAARALPRAFSDGNDAEAREDLMLAALWSGMGLAHCGLGAAHAIAAPLGGTFLVPHGMACASTISHVMATNLRVAERKMDGKTIRRYAEVSRAMGLSEGTDEIETARTCANQMAELCHTLGVPKLREHGVGRTAFPDLVTRARRTSSMKSNPVDLTDKDLFDILERAI